MSQDYDDKQRVPLSGKPPDPDHMNRGAPQPIDPKTGMYRDYWVLSEEERAKGFVRPVRRTYIHRVCQTSTTMALALAQTYARDPKFYGGTFCCACKKHFPVSEFEWEDGSEVGS